jgi:hypothetical protein
MSQVQFNINEVKEVVVKTADGNLRPMGVDFPDGTRWRKPVVLHRAPAPVAACHYVRGDRQHPGTEHSSESLHYLLTEDEQPRWHDSIVTKLNMPTDWGHDAQTLFDEVEVDYSTTSSSSIAEGYTFDVGRDTLPAMWCITSASYSSNYVNVKLEIYNPGCRSVSWDICNSSGVSVGSSIVSGWYSGATSSYRTLEPKTRTSITIRCLPEKLFPNNTYGPGATGSMFYIHFKDLYTLRNENTIYGICNEEFHLQCPQATSSVSSGFSLVYYSSGIKIAKGPRVSKLPAEIRTVPYSANSSIPYLTIKNPFSTSISYDIRYCGIVADPVQEREIYWGTLNANTATTFRIYEYSVDGSQKYNYFCDANNLTQFTMYYCTPGGTYNGSGNYHELLIAMPRLIYPPVITRYNTDTGREVILQIYNPNSFAATFDGSAYVNSGAKSIVWKNGATCRLAAYGTTTVTITCSESTASIECGGTLTATRPEDGGEAVSSKSVYKQSFSTFAQTQVPQYTKEETHSGLSATITNVNDFTVWCYIRMSGETITDTYINPETGREEEIWRSYTISHCFSLGGKATRSIFFAIPGSSGQYQTDGYVSAPNKFRETLW